MASIQFPSDSEYPPETEWRFDLCPKSEAGVCWSYESAREIVLRFSGKRAAAIRKGVESTRESLRRTTEREARRALVYYLNTAPLHEVILVCFEEWPQKAYLSIEVQERQRRLAKLMPDFFPTAKWHLAKGILPFQIPPEFQPTLQKLIEMGKLPITWVDMISISDYQLERREGAPESDVILSDNPRAMLPLLIDPSDTRTRFLNQCGELWDVAISRYHEPSGRKRGRGSLFAANLPDLNRLAAYRLIKVYRLNYQEAILFTTERCGKAIYENESNFRRAVRECESILRKYLACRR
jgi:hypothetical protein